MEQFPTHRFKNSKFGNPDGLIDILLQDLTKQIEAVRAEIRGHLWASAQNLKEGNYIVDAAVEKMGSIEQDHEMYEKGDPGKDPEYQETKIALVLEVGEYKDVQDIVKPLYEKQRKLRKQRRHLKNQKENYLHN